MSSHLIQSNGMPEECGCISDVVSVTVNLSPIFLG